MRGRKYIYFLHIKYTFSSQTGFVMIWFKMIEGDISMYFDNILMIRFIVCIRWFTVIFLR